MYMYRFKPVIELRRYLRVKYVKNKNNTIYNVIYLMLCYLVYVKKLKIKLIWK